MKEKWGEFFLKQKKSIYYWAIVILIIDAVLAAQHITLYLQSGQCRNYLSAGSAMHACSLGEFVKYGWQWISFADTFLFIPAVTIMIVTTYVVDQVFAKKD